MRKITTVYAQKGENDPLRGEIRLISKNKIELQRRYRGGRQTKRVWYNVTIAVNIGQVNSFGSMVFRGGHTEFYINPADWRRLTGVGFEVAKEGETR